MRIFRYREDRVPVLLITSLFALDCVVYLRVHSVPLVLGWMIVGLLPKVSICAWNHHHQHVPTFRVRVLNRLLEVVYALQTGVTTNGWVLHHVLGHHLNYLDQSLDESAWRKADGRPMRTVEYTIINALAAYPRAFRVGRKHPRYQRTFASATSIVLAVLAGLLWLDWVNALLVFVIPMAAGLIGTVWHTYYHHAGLDAAEHYAASYNITDPVYNLLTGNLGYHTAHHIRPGLHWSRLPQFHARIAHRIPPHLYRRPTLPFGGLIVSAYLKVRRRSRRSIVEGARG
jgi:fatty acid desaturase